MDWRKNLSQRPSHASPRPDGRGRSTTRPEPEFPPPPSRRRRDRSRSRDRAFQPPPPRRPPMRPQTHAAAQGGGCAQLNPHQINALITRQCRSPQEILDVWRKHGSRFNEVNCATALHRISKLALGQRRQSNLDLSELLDSVRLRLTTSPHAFQPQHLANIRRERGRKEESRSMKAWV